jgi:hypothetical protein
MRQIVVLLAILLGIATPSAAVERSPVVLGTVSRTLAVDVNGDGIPDVVRFDAHTRLFSVKGPGDSFLAYPIKPADRVLIWNFDEKVRGSGFILLEHDEAASNGRETFYNALIFRWHRAGWHTPAYQLSFQIRLATDAGTLVDWFIQRVQVSLRNWVNRREKSWRTIASIQQALKAGIDHRPLLAKHAVLPPGSLRLLERLAPDWEEYEEHGDAYVWFGTVAPYRLMVTTVIEGRVFKLKEVKIER